MLKNILQKITGGDKTYSYEEAKTALKKQNRRDKTILASHAETKPEILYYLATDESPEVRREIAINQNTPHQANDLLVKDEDTEVRQELARKIARMLPDLTDDEVSKVRESALEILETLANDQLPQVRKIVSEELKTFDCVPKQIIRKLADDDHLEVCAPVLEYSPLLSTEDLKEIIAATTVSGAIKAIAQRDQVNEEVSEAVTASLDIPAVAALLANKNAQIRESTLDKIISQANEMEELHRPLAERPNLSLRAIKRIAGFVASSLVNRMISAHDLDESIATELLKQVRERIQETTGDEDDAESLASQAAQFHAKGLLDDAFIENTIKNRQRELLFHCLAQLAEMPLTSIRKILTSKKARRVVALAWRAELNMRTAIKLQLEIACIPSSQVINAKEGVQYPLSRAEMEYDLALYDGGT
ncbi:DUF2336 domain-containing protein [Paremcibacter congregatus]|uniref:DUF2336 domain-containing protein n=1 Tax=Paremcibacter congregatus TaxID=2043170 RepID=A0A2G4YWB1_9PROT|nr:DUF2336 domain-containing protein [Paremcibacter congregatus]PHZ86632.1 hypothetical protein CRD36_01795 [Paremcibacter congregatus]QDE26434.1 DUF2336 domain-containing protein [Paremcibacter congregatus]